MFVFQHRSCGLAAGQRLAALALLSGCGRPGAGDAHASNGPPPAPEVQVAEVALQAIRPWDEFNGRIEAVESVQLRSRVSGYIERIAFAEGQEVKKGQLLFVIDQRPYRAALASAQAQLERARAAAGLAQTQDQRARQLVAENAVSREEADTRAATLAQATAQVRAAEAELATARLQLDFTEVRAPITGRASRALLTVGNMAQADQSVLTTLVSQDPVYAYFDADEHSFLRYQKAGLAARAARCAWPWSATAALPMRARWTSATTSSSRARAPCVCARAWPTPTGC
jgi:multidrug efflux system membrane fusion protein